MLNTWGICSFGAGTYDPMTHWDLSCIFFAPVENPRAASPKQCCANCTHWLIYDEHLRLEEE